jgi:hypothetical protein
MSHETRPDRVMQIIETPLECQGCEYGASPTKCQEFLDSLEKLRPGKMWQCGRHLAWRRIG